MLGRQFTDRTETHARNIDSALGATRMPNSRKREISPNENAIYSIPPSP